MSTGELEFICDAKRHLVCLPYSIENLHAMARVLDLDRCWFHKDHYDIPIKRISEIMDRCRIVSSKEIVRIVDRSSAKRKKSFKKSKSKSSSQHVESSNIVSSK